jgi:hypothetical protein
MFNEFNKIIENVLPLPIELIGIVKEYLGGKKEFLKDRKIKKINNMYANFIIFLCDESYKLGYTETYLNNHLNNNMEKIRKIVIIKRDIILYNFLDLELNTNFNACRLCKRKIKKVNNCNQSLTYHLMYQCQIFNSF